MELFEVVIQYFPMMQKQASALFKKVPPEKRFGSWKFVLAAEMIQWIWDELLDEHSFLYQTFLRAGFTNKLDMSCAMFQWHLIDNQLSQNRRK